MEFFFRPLAGGEHLALGADGEVVRGELSAEEEEARAAKKLRIAARTAEEEAAAAVSAEATAKKAQAKLEGQRAFLQAAQGLIVSAPVEFGCFRIGNDDRGQERVFCKTCEAHASLPTSRAARGAFVTGAIKCFSDTYVKQRQTVRNPSPSSQACCWLPTHAPFSAAHRLRQEPTQGPLSF